MSMKPTCRLRFVTRDISVPCGVDIVSIDTQKVLQQLWIDEADGRINEWRDVEIANEDKEG